MLAYGYRANLLQRARVEQHHFAAAPDRDEQRTSVGRHQGRVGLGRQLGRARDSSPNEIDSREPPPEYVDGKQPTAIGRDRYTTDKPRAAQRLESGFHDRSSEHELARRLQPALMPFQLVDDVLCRSGGEESGSVGVPRETEPRVLEWHALCDVEVRRFENGERWLGPPVFLVVECTAVV